MPYTYINIVHVFSGTFGAADIFNSTGRNLCTI